MSYINNYPFIAVFSLLVIFFIIISLFVKIKLIKLFSISFIAILVVLLFIETILSFYMRPILTTSIELYNKTDSFFPQKKASYKVAEILLYNHRNRKWFLIDEQYTNNKKNFVKDNKVIFEAIYTIDKNGLRYTKSNENSKDAFLFLGCSFVFGACVNDNETLPYCFSEKFGFNKNVINLGMDARGINRAYSILSSKDYIKYLLGNSKIKYIFYEYMYDQKERAFRYSIPSDILVCEDGVKYEVKQPFKIIKKYFTRCLIYKRFFSNFVEKFSNKFYYRYLQKMFLKMYNISKQRYDSNFVVIMWNQDKNLESFFVEKGIDFIKAYNFIDYYNDSVKFDGHPNANANKKIAGSLIDYLKNKGDL